MKSRQTNKLAMYRAVKARLQVATETSGIAALPARLTDFVSLIATIDELDRAQNMPTHGRVEDRDARIEALIEQTLELAGYATSHARDRGLRDVEARVAVSRADFSRLRLVRRPTLAQQVHDALVPLAADLARYGVTAETLAAHRAAIEEATAAVNEPRATITAKRMATEAMARAFAEADDLLETHIDALLFPLRRTHPEFHAGYEASRQVTRLGAKRESEAAEMPEKTAAAIAPSAPAPLDTRLAA